MTATDPAQGAPFAFLKTDLARQRIAARGLLDDVAALDRLLASDTAALGTDEIAFSGSCGRTFCSTPASSPTMPTTPRGARPARFSTTRSDHEQRRHGTHPARRAG